MNTTALGRSGSGVLRGGGDVAREEVRRSLNGEISLHPVQNGRDGGVVIEHDEGVERSRVGAGDDVVEGDDGRVADAVRRELLSSSDVDGAVDEMEYSNGQEGRNNLGDDEGTAERGALLADQNGIARRAGRILRDDERGERCEGEEGVAHRRGFTRKVIRRKEGGQE